MRTVVCSLAVLSSLAAAAPAAAAPIDLGPGRDPSVVVDPAGTAHIVFDSSPSIPNQITTYCRLPRGAAACDVRTDMPLEFMSEDPRIFRRASDGALIVLQVDGRDYDPDRLTFSYGGAWIRVSTDGGRRSRRPR